MSLPISPSPFHAFTPDTPFADALTASEREREKEKVRFVSVVWREHVAGLHSIGEQVKTKDLHEISTLREPPVPVANVLGYLAALMGLRTDWKTVRGTLLKENDICCNFLREVRVKFNSI